MAKTKIAIIGTGPAALMAGSILVKNPEFSVNFFEKADFPSRKLLLAGKTGLNISNGEVSEKFLSHYFGDVEKLKIAFENFNVKSWIDFLAELGFENYLGTSNRYFLKEKNTETFVIKWIEYIKNYGGIFNYSKHVFDFEVNDKNQVKLKFKDKTNFTFDFAIFALGGASYSGELFLEWPQMFINKGINFTQFTPSNCGFEAKLPEAFFKEAEGKPLSKIKITSSKGERIGSLMTTKYGFEGTPIYSHGEIGKIYFDLLPDLTVEKIHEKLSFDKKKLSPIRKIFKYLKLSEAAQALVFHSLDDYRKSDLTRLVNSLKKIEIHLTAKRPIGEAISSAGGINTKELSPNFNLIKFPNIYCAGEMIDWDAETGGFLIQMCVSQGALIAKSIIEQKK